MTTDVGTTLRKPLTPRQLLKLFEREHGVCCICGLPIEAGRKWKDTLKGEKGFIDEHKRALGLGGGNEPDNRGIAHIKCAEVKTHDQDMPAINKAKAVKRRHLGIETPSAKIKSAPFPRSSKSLRRENRDVLPIPSRKAMYVERT